MTLGLLLLAGMVAVFAGNKRSSELNTAMANMQENARFALEAIARDGRMSGFQGCIDMNRGSLAVRANNAPTNDLRATASSGSIVESATSWNPLPPAGLILPITPAPIVGTHTLLLQFGGATIARLTGQLQVGSVPSPAGPVAIDRDLGLAAGQLAVIANCDTADLFRVSSVTASAGGTSLTHLATHNDSGNLTRAYGDALTINQTSVMRFFSNIYYVGDTGLSNEYGDPIHALYQQSLPYGDANNPPIELVQGVENMRVSFGIRQPTGTLMYLPPDAAGFDATRVESVQVGLLLASWDRITDQEDGNTYTLAGQQIPASKQSIDGSTHPRDRRYRLAFNTTIKIRNRRNDS